MSIHRVNNRQTLECGDGKPPCHRAPASSEGNPLMLCDDHLAAYRRRLGLPEPVLCPACNPFSVMVDGRYIVIVGVMCFACDRTNGGTVPSAQHRADARKEMRARLLALWREGDRGPEWAALLARCPADLREAFERRMTQVAPGQARR